MEPRFKPMNDGYMTGVIDLTLHGTWVIEPEYTWQQAQVMANELNKNPNLDPDELSRIVEAA